MPSLSSELVETRNSPYINRFLQPDTVIPDLSNPQSWNRYSYVNNRPVNFNDPTGHWAGTMTLAGFGVLGIGAIGAALLAPEVLAIAAGVAVVAIVAITVITVVEMAKSGRPATKYRKDEQNISTIDKTVDDPGGGGPWQINCKGAIATILCGTAFLRVAKYGYDTVNCMIDEKNCSYASTNEKIIADPKSTQTPTSTGTSTPSCPPYAQCPTHTATASTTPSPSNTPTATSTSTSTPTSTPTLTPSPTYVPSTPRRHGGLLGID